MSDYDVIVIGGGINGAAIAASVARRGYRTLVLEQGDFASGTTAASTKLIHGGLRYLETGNARLVHESLQSRERLLRERPHLVRSLAFLLPVYRGDPRPAPYIRAGLGLYDLLSPRKVAPWHRSFSPRQLQRFEPAVETEDLQTAYLFHDAQVTMPERLCLEYLAEAEAAGADLRNYAAVDFIAVSEGRARGVDFHDVLSGSRHHATARLIVNAAGPWVDAVLEATGQSLPRRIGGTKGSHLVLDLQGRGPRHAILANARSDGRHIFVVPWLDHHLLGTTDVRFEGDPSQARLTPWEVDYLLSEADRILPGVGVDREHILYGYSGVRPLPASAPGVSEGAITRRAFLIDHQEDGVRLLFSIVGGKLTTARRLGRAVADAAARAIGAPSAGRIRPLPSPPPSRVSFLPADTQQHLRDRYGDRAAEVAAYAALDPALGEPVSPYHADIGAQVVYAIAQEHARTLGDVLLRRTAIGLTHDLGRAAAPTVAAIMQRHQKWSDAERDQAVRDYFAELHRRFVVFEAGGAAQTSAASAEGRAAQAGEG